MLLSKAIDRIDEKYRYYCVEDRDGVPRLLKSTPPGWVQKGKDEGNEHP